MKKIFRENKFLNILITLLIAVIFYLACNEFYEIAWGTGTWRGEFSRTWAMLYYSFIVFCVFIFALAALSIWNNKLVAPFTDRIKTIREQLGIFRWLLWLVIFIAPVWFFQYTAWGFVFQKLYIRVLIWIIVVCLLTILSSRHKQLAGWNEFLASLVLTASAFSIAASLKNVNNYPFSLGWSEGNRLWDYSVLFGKNLYIYPKDKQIPVLLDLGRRLIGGLPFIFPGVTITIARLWVGLTQIIPYLLLGLALFRFAAKDKLSLLLLTLWTFLFLQQGPIHPPLVLSAALVALAWDAPLWYAIPLVIGAGYFAEASRFTWIFASGIWIFMLEFSSAAFSNPKLGSAIWKRSITLGVLGIFGGLILPNLIGSSAALMPSPDSEAHPIATEIAQLPVATATIQSPSASTAAPAAANSKPTFIDSVVNIITIQPLLWYRLLPNSTYGYGILFALLLAIGPLSIILIYLLISRLWSLSKLQKIAIVLPLLAFLAVGLVASTKIGGGGDLHNMDMFLIGLLFTGAIAWQNGGSDWLQNSQIVPVMKIMIVLLLINSSVGPLLEMRSFSLGEDSSWLKTLADAKSETALGMLPTQVEINSALQTIQTESDNAKLHGEVLFMDQRQLLTFGYIKNIPFVPDYEKKLLMNQALSGDTVYFRQFYADLAAKRFSLIITEPLHTPTQDSTYQFGEENNAWVKWVSEPVLCYYEPLTTLKTVKVQLLVPIKGTVDCSSVLP
jgi:hypothetical protein